MIMKIPPSLSILASGLIFHSFIHAANFPDGTFPDGIGVNAGTTAGSLSATDMANIQAAGVKYVRIRCAWPDVEQTKGSYNWTALDAVVAKLTQAGVMPIFAPAYTANGYDTDGIVMNEPAERQGFANFAAAAVARYPDPDFLWEIWNEPNTDNFWPGYNANHYMDLIDTAVPAMRAANADCTVVAGSVLDMVWSQTVAWLDVCFARDLFEKVDGLSVHPYSGPGKNPHPERVVDEMIALRNQLDAHGAPPDFPILNSEYGAPYSSFSGSTTQQKQEAQAGVCVRMALLCALTGMKTSVWYEWQPSGGNQEYALTNSNDTIRPGYTAVDVMTAQLAGYTVESRLAGYRAKDVVLVLASGTNRKLAVWTDDTPAPLAIPVSAGTSFSTVSTLGATGSVSVQNGKIQAPADGMPLFINIGSATVSTTNPLLALDIPTLSLIGSTTEAGGVFTVQGSGSGIAGATDRFHFGYQVLEGDGEVTARVSALPTSNARAGVMIRRHLGTNSPRAATLLQSDQDAEFSRRTAESAQSVSTVNSAANYAWVRIARSGDLFTSYASVDGVAWTQIGSETIPMGRTVYAGLAVSSHNSSTLAQASFDNYQLSGGPVPSPWQELDIPDWLTPGSATYSNGVFTITGEGTGIGAAVDRFHYVYQTSTGDCSITARVNSVQQVVNSSKAGVMIRDGLAANARMASMTISANSGAWFTTRATAGAQAVNTQSTGIAAPYWVRLTRVGDTFRGYISANGTAWTQVGPATTISMPSAATFGLAVTSSSQGNLCTGTAGNVTASP